MITILHARLFELQMVQGLVESQVTVKKGEVPSLFINSYISTG